MMLVKLGRIFAGIRIGSFPAAICEFVRSDVDGLLLSIETNPCTPSAAVGVNYVVHTMYHVLIKGPGNCQRLFISFAAAYDRWLPVVLLMARLLPC